MNILVTGGAGFIGSHIVKFHLNQGDEVCAIDNFFSGKKENIEPFLSQPNFSFVQEDICIGPSVKDLVEWSDRIYHMAAIVGQKKVISQPIETISINIHACERILQILSKTKKKIRFLVASSSCVYDHNHSDFPMEESAPLLIPSGCYIQETYPFSKIVNEMMALAYTGTQNVDCIIARLFNIIGPNQTGRYGMVVPTFVQQATQNQPLTIYGDGTQKRAFCHVHDAVFAMYLLMQTPESKGQIINVGHDEEVSIRELAELIIRKAQSLSSIVHIPYQEAYGISFQDVRKRKPELKKLKKLTGYVPKINLNQTLEELILDSRSSIKKSK